MSLVTIPEPAVEPLPLSDPDALYEVVDGQRLELPPMGVLSVRVTSLLSHRLGPHAEANGLGIVDSEMLFVLDRDRGLKRRPDLAFVSSRRWPVEREIPEGEAWDIVPNLAVEVSSPTDRLWDVLGKVREYFEAGVELVWLFIPSERLIYIYESPTQLRVIDATGELDGGAVVPGFRVPAGELFPRIIPAS